MRELDYDDIQRQPKQTRGLKDGAKLTTLIPPIVALGT